MGCHQRSVVNYSTTYSDYAMILLPKGWKGDGTIYGGVACHGATGLPMVYTDTNQGGPSSIRLAHMLVEEFGRPIICPFLGGDQFGNAFSTTCMDEAVTYLSSALGCKPGKAFLFGESMGAGSCMSYAVAHPSKVISITGLVPLSNLLTIWQNNRAGVTASVNAAAGGTYVPATNGPSMDPNVFAPALAGIPTDLWASSDDTVVLLSEVQALKASIGTSAHLTALTGAHGEGAISTITAAQQQQIGDFIQRNCVAA